MENSVLITNDAVVFGLLATILGGIFYTYHSALSFWQKFYKYVPVVLMCYFIPSLLNTFSVVDGKASQVYFVASRYLLPACIVLLTISVDLKAISNLGSKAIIMFLTGTIGVVIGGPIAILILSGIYPDAVGGSGSDAVWRGMTTVAGSWIGGGANQAAMKEIYQVGGNIFSAMVTVDILVGMSWMAVLLYMAGNAEKYDAKVGADNSAIKILQKKIADYQAENSRISDLKDIIFMVALSFGVTGLAHFLADQIAPFFQTYYPETQRFSFTSQFFWLIVIATSVGIGLSFTKARKIEDAGASKVGSLFIYILVAAIGLHMDVTKIVDSPKLFLIGFIWILVHISLLLIVAKLIKAPLFFVAVGSQANIGGAASAPVVASAFHPSLAPVGVLLAVLGYAIGTYMAWFCGYLMMTVSGG